jgi:hypothetical protein
LPGYFKGALSFIALYICVDILRDVLPAIKERESMKSELKLVNASMNRVKVALFGEEKVGGTYGLVRKVEDFERGQEQLRQGQEQLRQEMRQGQEQLRQEMRQGQVVWALTGMGVNSMVTVFVVWWFSGGRGNGKGGGSAGSSM